MMGKFVFELEALLRMRAREEREAQGELAELNARAAVIRDEITGAQRTVVSFKEDWRVAAGAGRVDLGAVGRQATAVLGQQVKAQAAAVRLAQMGPALEAARARVVAASQRRRAVELLKERRLRTWKDRESRRLVAELDDVVMSRVVRGGAQGMP